MSDVVLVALIGAVPATLAVILGVLQARRLSTVHDAVNGGLTAARAELRIAREKIEALEEELRR